MIRSRTGVVAAGTLLVAASTVWAGASPAFASLACTTGTSITQAAPATGSSALVHAGTVGTYTVTHTGTGTLAISGTPTAASGWTASTVTSSGAKVKVNFQSTTSTALDRFTTSLSGSQAKLITHVVTCH